MVYRSPDIPAKIDHYLDSFSPRELLAVRALAHELKAQARSNRSLGDSIAFIPVGPDESPWIPDTMQTYADQPPPTGGFSVILGLNTRIGAGVDIQTHDVAYGMPQHFPHLDVRVVNLGVFNGRDRKGNLYECILSPIRRRLAAVALAAIRLEETGQDKDRLLHIHDIDLRELSPTFLPDMEEASTAHPGMPLMPAARHEVIPDKPLLSALVCLCDLDGLFSVDTPVFEPALAMPVSTYCDSKGHDPRWKKMGETTRLAQRTRKKLVTVPHAQLVSSSRRHEQQFRETHGIIWPSPFEFPTLSYRRHTPKDDLPGSAANMSLQWTWLSNLTQYKTDIRNFVKRKRVQGADFETARDDLWEWAKACLTTAQPRIDEFFAFMDQTAYAELSFSPDTITWWAHVVGTQALRVQYKVEDIDKLITGGIKEGHLLSLERTTGLDTLHDPLDELYLEYVKKKKSF